MWDWQEFRTKTWWEQLFVAELETHRRENGKADW